MEQAMRKRVTDIEKSKKSLLYDRLQIIADREIT